MGFRATEEERRVILQKSRECGISQSEYIRKRALNHRPKARLTEREVAAYVSIADARADLIHIKNALSGKSQAELLRYFRDPAYMSRWIEATDYLIRRFYEIEDYLAKG